MAEVLIINKTAVEKGSLNLFYNIKSLAISTRNYVLKYNKEVVKLQRNSPPIIAYFAGSLDQFFRKSLMVVAALNAESLEFFPPGYFLTFQQSDLLSRL